MTAAAPVLRLQAAHYHAVRARLWPPRPRLIFTAPKREWRTPHVTPLYRSLDNRIAAILIEADRLEYVTPRRIIGITAEVFDVPVSDIIGERRFGFLVLPRQIGMAVCRKLLAGNPRGSFNEIGRAFRRDYTCVMHAHAKYGAMVERVHQQITAGAA